MFLLYVTRHSILKISLMQLKNKFQALHLICSSKLTMNVVKLLSTARETEQTSRRDKVSEAY